MSQLQEYVDSQVATISPFKIKSQEILEQAKAEAAKTQKPTVKSGIKTKAVFTVTNPESISLICEAIVNRLRETPGVEVRREKSF
jgi:hypothetical protein